MRHTIKQSLNTILIPLNIVYYCILKYILYQIYQICQQYIEISPDQLDGQLVWIIE